MGKRLAILTQSSKLLHVHAAIGCDKVRKGSLATWPDLTMEVGMKDNHKLI